MRPSPYNQYNQRPPSNNKEKPNQTGLPNYPLLLNKGQSTPTYDSKISQQSNNQLTSNQYTNTTLQKQQSDIYKSNYTQQPSYIQTPQKISNTMVQSEQPPSYNQYTTKQSDNYKQLQSNTQQTKIVSTIMTQSQPEQYSSKSNVSRGICGLRNIGNTCFMNSVLQCLFNIPRFNEHFINGDYDKDVQSRINSIPNEYCKLISSIRSTPNFQSISPYGIKSAVENVTPNFRGYAQQDAQEFLVALLDGMSLGLNRVRGKPTYKEMNDNLNGRTLQDLSKEWWDYSKSRENSLVLDYFQGQLLHQIKCQQCGSTSYAFDTFQDISLAIVKAFKILEDMNLERLLDKYMIEEAIDDYYCSKCKKHQKVKRKFILWRLPHILVFHIKRFDFRRFSSDKLNHRVIFPLELDMGEFVRESSKIYVILDDQSTKNSQYLLSGIVNHSGTLYGGHYTADSMNPQNQKWYRYNDSDVREIDIKSQRYDTDGSSNPYILFYSRKQLY